MGGSNGHTDKRMRISEGDWAIFLKCAHATLKAFSASQVEFDEGFAFVQGTKANIFEA